MKALTGTLKLIKAKYLVLIIAKRFQHKQIKKHINTHISGTPLACFCSLRKVKVMHNPFVCCTCGTPDPERLPWVSAALDQIQIVQGVTLIWRIISWG